MTQGPLNGRRVAFLATNGVEESELAEPWAAVTAAGATAELISLEPGSITSTSRGEPGQSFHVDRPLTDLTELGYDALIVPGGLRNPDTLRMERKAVDFVRGFMEHDKPVASICHGPWLLVEAGAVRGRTLTSFPSLRTDIENAGGVWVDREVVVDEKLITSRMPKDLPAFCSTVVSVLAESIEERSLDRMVEQSFPASDPLPGPTAI